MNDNTSEPCEPSAAPWPVTTEEIIERAAREGKRVTYVNDGAVPASFTDLFVYQPNPMPKKFDYEKIDYFLKNYFVLPAEMQPISSVSGLIIAARRACTGGRKLRYLRIMGHGNPGGIRIGLDWVGPSALISIDTKQKTDMYHELEKLKAYLVPRVSIVILDHCLAGQSERLLVMLSEMWGGVDVRGFEDYQLWEHDAVQVGQGPYRQCAGKKCHFGVEVVRIQ